MTVFVTGMMGMALEIVGMRLVSPIVGGSIEVWSVVISIFMLGLALGYFWGKYFRSPYGLIGLSGLFISIIYIYISNIDKSGTINLWMVTGSFFVPIFLLGLTYPLMSKYLPVNYVYGLSTLGSILGTLLPTFIFIPYFGTRITFLLIVVVLEIIAFLGLTKWQKAVPVAIIFWLSFMWPKNIVESNVKSIYKTESKYQLIEAIKSGDYYYLNLGEQNNGMGYFSSKYNKNIFLTDSYYDSFLMLPYFLPKQNKLDLLVLGLGGGTMTRQYQHYFSATYDLDMDGVEIDQEVVSVAKKYFELEQENLNIFVEDGRMFLNKTQKNYDLIFVDVYAKQSYIPHHMATVEFMNLGKKHLNLEGIMAYNVSDNTTDKTRLNRIVNTMSEVFDFVYKIYPNVGSEFLVLGSNNKINFEADLSAVVKRDLANVYSRFKNFRFERVTNTNVEYVLTDDKSVDRI